MVLSGFRWFWVVCCFISYPLEANVNDFNITFKLDNGAQCSIILIATFNKMKNKPKLLKTKTTLKVYDEHNIDIVGKCNMILSFFSLLNYI